VDKEDVKLGTEGEVGRGERHNKRGEAQARSTTAEAITTFHTPWSTTI